MVLVIRMEFIASAATGIASAAAGKEANGQLHRYNGGIQFCMLARITIKQFPAGRKRVGSRLEQIDSSLRLSIDRRQQQRRHKLLLAD